jgi:hypothetical protein
MEIRRNYSASQRNLRLDKGIRDAVADLLRQRWPSGTAKMAAREFRLSVDRAREAVQGRASLTTVEQIIKQGGPPVALPIIEAVWGGSLAHYFAELRKSHEDHGERLAALVFSPAGLGGSHRGGSAGPGGLAGHAHDASAGRVGDADAEADQGLSAHAGRGRR